MPAAAERGGEGRSLLPGVASLPAGARFLRSLLLAVGSAPSLRLSLLSSFCSGGRLHGGLLLALGGSGASLMKFGVTPFWGGEVRFLILTVFFL